MPSATLPAELYQIARDAARNARRPAPPRTATILGLGHYLPSEVVPNGPIAERIGVDDEWIVKRTGIHARRRVAPNERTSDLGVFAGRRALQDAGVDPMDLDHVIVATMTADELTPNCAPLVANALGAARAATYDVGAACTGFLAGLSQASALVEVGRAERILLIGAESLTRLADLDDKKTAMLWGDGAGAAVIGPSENGAGIGRVDLLADGGLGDTIVATHEYGVAAAGLELEDIDLFVYHQANGRILRAVGERLDLDPAKVADYIGQLGNTSAASVPLTLSLSREDGRLRPGMKVLLGAIGAGFTWGTGVMEWGLA
jgi:3-oxoacyl-[acyl-carrier-protein] synthase III